LQESEEPKTEEPVVDTSQKSEGAASQSKVGDGEVLHGALQI